MPIAREISSMFELTRKPSQVFLVVLLSRSKIAKIAKDKGVYPQSDRSLGIVNIYASKGFVDLWVHLSFAIFAIFDLKRQLKLLEMACDQVLTCLIFPFRWACFPIKTGRNAQWVHLFSMDFDEFSIIYLIF